MQSPAGGSPVGLSRLVGSFRQAAPNSINTMIRLMGRPSNQSRMGMTVSLGMD
jgi:hypothetical protein